MMKSQMIEEILRLRGFPKAQWPAMKAKLEAYSDEDIWDTLQFETQKAEASTAQTRPYPQRFSKKAKPQRKSAKKASAKKAAPKKSAKVSKTLQRRVTRLSRAIKSGKIAVKKGIKSPADVGGKRMSRAAKAEKFVKTYKGARVSRKGARKGARNSR
jgi:hypothetical protein